jgi:hypothetical protein
MAALRLNVYALRVATSVCFRGGVLQKILVPFLVVLREWFQELQMQ